MSPLGPYMTQSLSDYSDVLRSVPSHLLQWPWHALEKCTTFQWSFACDCDIREVYSSCFFVTLWLMFGSKRRETTHLRSEFLALGGYRAVLEKCTNFEHCTSAG